MQIDIILLYGHCYIGHNVEHICIVYSIETLNILKKHHIIIIIIKQDQKLTYILNICYDYLQAHAPTIIIKQDQKLTYISNICYDYLSVHATTTFDLDC